MTKFSDEYRIDVVSTVCRRHLVMAIEAYVDHSEVFSMLFESNSSNGDCFATSCQEAEARRVRGQENFAKLNTPAHHDAVNEELSHVASGGCFTV